ncbi:MAG: DUF1294 domain-containing protein [Arcobacteraceae bacterium]
MNTLFLIALTINIITFFFFGLDKQLAIKNKHRISENKLHILSIFGGFIGAFVAMFLFRHKIKKFPFMLIQTTISILWILLIGYKLYKIS